MAGHRSLMLIPILEGAHGPLTLANGDLDPQPFTVIPHIVPSRELPPELSREMNAALSFTREVGTVESKLQDILHRQTFLDAFGEYDVFVYEVEHTKFLVGDLPSLQIKLAVCCVASEGVFRQAFEAALNMLEAEVVIVDEAAH